MKMHILKGIINRCHLILLFSAFSYTAFPQNTESNNLPDSSDKQVNPVPETRPAKIKPVKNTFQSVWIIDNQTVMVPVKKTFEMDIQHRFGTINKGYEDFWGLFAPSNIRLGVSYSPVKKLYVGLGVTKSNLIWDFSAKYAIIQQTKGIYPVSITYYGNFGFDTRKDGTNGPFDHFFSNSKIVDGEGLFNYYTDRLIFYNEIIVARKISNKISVQVSPNLSHQNSVYGYYAQVDSATRKVKGEMQHDHFAIALAARFKLTNITSLMVNLNQPITKHATNNPNPNVSFGFEFSTGSHAFQLFLTNYTFLNPARNNLYNKNNWQDNEFVIGFNITRLWNY